MRCKIFYIGVSIDCKDRNAPMKGKETIAFDHMTGIRSKFTEKSYLD